MQSCLDVDINSTKNCPGDMSKTTVNLWSWHAVCCML